MTFDRMLAMLDDIDGEGNVMIEIKDAQFAAYVAWRMEFAKSAIDGYDMFDAWQGRQPEIDQRDAKIAELESKISTLNKMVYDRNAEIEEFEAVILAEKSQEPVAWKYVAGEQETPWYTKTNPSNFSDDELSENEVEITPLYAEPNPPAVQDGYAIVPLEITGIQRAILADYSERVQRGDCVLFADIYDELIAAAPKQGV